MTRTFHHTLRAGYGDTDKSGVVHHAVYLRYLEDARVELLRSLGLDFARLEDEERVSLVVAAASLRYRRPARFDDLLVVEIRVGRLLGASVRLDCRVLRPPPASGAPAPEAPETEPLVEAEITLACVDLDTLRPKRLPFRPTLERWLAEGARG